MRLPTDRPRQRTRCGVLAVLTSDVEMDWHGAPKVAPHFLISTRPCLAHLPLAAAAQPATRQLLFVWLLRPQSRSSQANNKSWRSWPNFSAFPNASPVAYAACVYSHGAWSLASLPPDVLRHGDGWTAYDRTTTPSRPVAPSHLKALALRGLCPSASSSVLVTACLPSRACGRTPHRPLKLRRLAYMLRV